MRILFTALFLLFALALPARAEFSVSSAIIEFTRDKPMQQDIEVVSRSPGTQYIVSEVYEIQNPGLPNEARVRIKDAGPGQLLVTPDRLVLAEGSRKLLRFVYMGQPGDREKVYRVVVKPVVKGLDNKAQVGLKVLVGYEVLAIVRPADIRPVYKAVRQGRSLTVSNTGNSDILLQNGRQCPAGVRPPADACVAPPVIRTYPGQSQTVSLPHDAPVFYEVWDGIAVSERQFD